MLSIITRVNRYWLDLPLRAKGLAVMSIPLLSLLIAVAASYSFMEQRQQAEDWVIHGHEVQTQIQSVYTLTAEAVTGVRGYLLTNREDFLQPYRSALIELPKHLADLKVIVSDNREQEVRAFQIERLVTRQLRFLEQLSTHAQMDSAKTLDTLLVESKMELDSLRDAFTEMQVEEGRLLEQRRRNEKVARRQEVVVIVLSAVVGLGGGLVAITLFIGAVLHRVQLLKINAGRLSQEQPLHGLPLDEDEIGQLGQELERSSALLRERSEALRGSRIELKRKNRVLDRQRQNLDRLARFRLSLIELHEASLADASRGAFYQRALESAVVLIPGAQGGTLLMEEDNGLYNFVASVGFDAEALACIHPKVEEQIDRNEVQRPRIVHNLSLSKELETQRRGLFERGGHHNEIKVTLYAPLIITERRVALLNLDNFENANAFNEEAVEMLAALAGQFSTILTRLTLEGELRRRNLELARANELKKELLANMSHELCTPLTTIIGFSELLANEAIGPLNEQQEQYLKNIYDAGNHLLSLVNDILDVSKFEDGKMELRLEHVDAAMLVKSALTVVKERVQRAEVLIRSRLPPDIGYFNADARKLKQILYNLLSNAIKFTPRGGTIMLEVKSLPDEVHFEVEDTGIGIAPEALDKLFKDFSQIDSSIVRQYEGIGLGLALTKRLVELHGGRVWAISELGKGSKFGFSVSRNL